MSFFEKFFHQKEEGKVSGIIKDTNHKGTDIKSIADPYITVTVREFQNTEFHLALPIITQSLSESIGTIVKQNHKNRLNIIICPKTSITKTLVKIIDGQGLKREVIHFGLNIPDNQISKLIDSLKNGHIHYIISTEALLEHTFKIYGLNKIPLPPYLFHNDAQLKIWILEPELMERSERKNSIMIGGLLKHFLDVTDQIVVPIFSREFIAFTPIFNELFIRYSDDKQKIQFGLLEEMGIFDEEKDRQLKRK